MFWMTDSRFSVIMRKYIFFQRMRSEHSLRRVISMFREIQSPVDPMSFRPCIVFSTVAVQDAVKQEI